MERKLGVMSKDSKDKSPNGWLATLLRRFLRNNVGIEVIPSLILKSGNTNTASRDEIKMSNNLIQELYKDKITFVSLLSLIANLLKPKRLNIKITVELEDGTIFTDTITPIGKD